MKRTVSMLVLGLAIASSSAMAEPRGAPGERGARRQESAGESQREPTPADPREGRRGEMPRGGGPRGEGVPGPSDGGRRGDRRDDARQGAYRNDRNDGIDRNAGNDRSGRDDRGFRGARPPYPSWNDPRPRGPDDSRRWNDGDRRGWRDERGRDWHYSRDWYDRYRADHFRYDRGRYLARQRFSIGIYFVPRGYAPRYWQRGQWLPASYYGERRYHLLDYWRFDLYDPPFGARWVRVGSDALLVDYGSGEVLDVVFELFW